MEDLIGCGYQVIVADPPWRYDHSPTKCRDVENHYPTMTLAEIMNLPVEKIAAKDAVLFLWGTAPKLPEALKVVEAWGFRYRTSAVWDKEHLGMGNYFRVQHEYVLIGKRGRFPTPPPSTRPRSVIRTPRRKHSEKPPELQRNLEKMYQKASKVELFARTHRAGWDAWGNEIE